MKILCKFPTRGRPTAFLARMREYSAMAVVPDQVAFLVSYDASDATMTPEIIMEAQKCHPDVTCVQGHSQTKIEACNADLNEYQKPWDVVLLISDDMFCSRQGWDAVIRAHMQAKFPDTDGSLWFYDGAQQKINTLTCYGRKYYDRFRFLYHPSYASFFCDNEQTDVGMRDGKLVFVFHGISTHQHPAWLGGMKNDATYARNHRFWAQDRNNYLQRKAQGFPI